MCAPPSKWNAELSQVHLYHPFSLLPELEKNPLLNVRNVKSVSDPWTKLREAKSNTKQNPTLQKLEKIHRHCLIFNKYGEQFMLRKYGVRAYFLQ
jgi:hypothetical protein